MTVCTGADNLGYTDAPRGGSWKLTHRSERFQPRRPAGHRGG